MEVFIPLACVFVLLAAIFIGARIFEKKRTQAMALVADELSLDFSPEGNAMVQTTLSGLWLFNQGHSRKFRNMMTGSANGVEIAIFTYQYTTGHGKHKQTHKQTVISFQSQHLSLPEFEMRLKGFFSKISKAFGYQYIGFDTHPDFSKRYLLRGPKELEIRDTFDVERLDFLEDLPKGVALEASNHSMIFYRSRKRMKPEQIRDLMEEGFRVYSRFKRRE